MKTVTKILLSAAALAVSAPAAAGTLVFTGSGGTTAGNTRNYSDGTVSATVMGFSVNSLGNITAWGRPNFYAGYGLGFNADGDHHTVDNDHTVDFLLFTFDQDVALTGGTFVNGGWDGIRDTDATVSYAGYDFAANGMAYNTAFNYGNFGTFMSGVGSSISGNMFESTTNLNYTSTRTFNAGLNTGSVWMVAASFANLDRQKDAFKLGALQYQLPDLPNGGAVPEPSTWAMLILGMGMVGGAMRRRNGAARKVRATLRFT